MMELTEKKQKILFIYLKTGGGHLAPAMAISKYIAGYHNNKAETVLYDAFTKTNPLVKYIIEDGYRISQTKAKWIYESLYAIHKVKLVSKITAFLISLFIRKGLNSFIQEINPDKIIIFHFFAIKPTYDIVKAKSLNIPIITLVTDPYIAHPIWFINKNQKFILFSNKLKKAFIKKGIQEGNISVFPFMIDEKFSKQATPEEIIKLKKNHGFEDRKILLILGGGEGIPKGINLLKALLKSKPQYYIAFVCGRNKKLFKDVSLVKNRGNYKRLYVYPYIDFVYDMISISDAVISKCGASTFMEILISGKVPIVNSYIWEQEKGNVRFITENGLGIYEKRVNKIADVVNKLFTDNNLYKHYKNNIAAYRLENGISFVSKHIVN
jgi:UDP-N-acetylglucosamine:LPS N-acetylglucosamine transferase